MAESESSEKASPEWFLYVLSCSDGSYYCGITTNLERRVDEHNRGVGAKYTRSRSPVRLLRSWSYPDRSTASKAEYRFKQLRRKAKEQRLNE